MTIPYAELVAAIRTEGQALAASGRQGLDQPVPTCPGWTEDRLLRHVMRVLGWATAAVVGRGEKVPPPARFTGPDPVRGLLDVLDELVGLLESAPPDSPAWNWMRPPHEVSWLARRIAAELTVHRWDGQFAHGFADRVSSDLAVDFVDEFYETVLPTVLPSLPRRGEIPVGVLVLSATDAPATWTVTVAESGDGRTADVVRDASPVRRSDVSVRAGASDLLLLVHNRPPQDTTEITGSAEWLLQWSRTVLV